MLWFQSDAEPGLFEGVGLPDLRPRTPVCSPIAGRWYEETGATRRRLWLARDGYGGTAWLDSDHARERLVGSSPLPRPGERELPPPDVLEASLRERLRPLKLPDDLTTLAIGGWGRPFLRPRALVTGAYVRGCEHDLPSLAALPLYWWRHLTYHRKRRKAAKFVAGLERIAATFSTHDGTDARAQATAWMGRMATRCLYAIKHGELPKDDHDYTMVRHSRDRITTLAPELPADFATLWRALLGTPVSALAPDVRDY